ncbi:MAG: hypothetical protein IT535_08350 [Bauldia sp.]|nr:hypothetical protein [Bauldia sp.]
MPQAIVFLTHILNRSIRSQYARLKREAAPYANTFFCYHASARPGLPDWLFQADIVVRPADGERLLPVRAAEMRERAKTKRAKYNGGFPDLVLMPVLHHPDLAGHDPVWMVEYDADFAGDWGEFFRRAEGVRADLLTAYVKRRADEPEWVPWTWFAPPAGIPEAEHLSAFNPVARYSRRFIDTYRAAIATGEWAGHTEALYPTIARQAGLEIVDLGGKGEFVPPGWEELNYTGRLSSDPRGSFRYRPDIGQRYFHQDPAAFALPGRLHHPIKAPSPLNLRVRYRPLRRRFRGWLRRLGKGRR